MSATSLTDNDGTPPSATPTRATAPVARKGSADKARGIVHTRMEDEQVQTEYSFSEIIGEGSFGKVYRATHAQSGETFAIKEIGKEKAGSSGLRQLEKEVSIFKKVDHKNIIKLKEVIETPKKMYLIMELCNGGDLAALLMKKTSLCETETKKIMVSLADSVKYLHQQGILHRDLKLENILLVEEPKEDSSLHLKLTDFGLSTFQNNNSYENMQEQYCGTLSYMAPEMNSTYSYPVDVWAMGIIMYYLLTKYPKDNVLNESLSKEGPKFEEPQWKSVSEQAKDLLREMLTINPAYRVTSGEVLNHEWFTGKKREHGNVLELMREFGREAKENNPTITEPASAINGNNTDIPILVTEDASPRKEQRKGSGGKKPSVLNSADSKHGPGLLKTTRMKTSTNMTASPRPMSKTPTPSRTYEPVSKSNIAATRTTGIASSKTSTPASSKPTSKTALNKNAKPKK